MVKPKEPRVSPDLLSREDLEDFGFFAEHNRARRLLAHPLLPLLFDSDLAYLGNPDSLTRSEMRRFQDVLGPLHKLGATHDDRISTYVAKVRKLPFYVWALRNPRFKRADEEFKRIRTRQSGKRETPADLAFLWVAWIAGRSRRLYSGGVKPKYAAKRDIKNSIHKARVLEASIKLLGLTYSPNRALHDELHSLIRDLESKQAGYRKPHTGKFSLVREFIDEVYEPLSSALGEIPFSLMKYLVEYLDDRVEAGALQKMLELKKNASKAS